MFDVIIVGLGAVGSAAAFQLAQRGISVLGIDRHAPPHALGSSHGDSRITRVAIGEGEQYTPLVRRSHQIWRELEERTGEELLNVTGGLIISSDARQATTHVPNFFENTLAAAKRFGIEHEMLGARELRELFPQFKVRDNEIGYYEPGAGYLRPEACVRAQLALAEEQGARLHRNERVLGVADAGGIVTVRTDAAEYRARQLIVAAGAWLPEFLDSDLARHFTVTRQVHYWFDVAAPIARFQPPNFPVWIWELQDQRHVIYGFPAIDGEAGGIKIATEQYALPAHPDTVSRDVGDDEKRAMYQNLVAPNFPDVGARCIKALTCLYTATPDFHFVIDRHPRMPNVVIASPCSGHGFKHSAAVGEALADMATGSAGKVDLGGFTLGRLGA